MDDYRNYGTSQKAPVSEQVKCGLLCLLIFLALLVVGHIEYTDSGQLATKLAPYDQYEIRQMTQVVNPRIYELSRAEANR